jgi:hypothetical protein
MLLSKTDCDHESGYGKLHDLEKSCDTLAAPNLYHCETLIRAKNLRGRLDVKTLNANILKSTQPRSATNIEPIKFFVLLKTYCNNNEIIEYGR